MSALLIFCCVSAIAVAQEDILVPDVVGLDQATATADIITAGLLLGSVTTQNDDLVPSGDVISQNPVAGSTVTPGSSVDIVVSLGPADIAVPDVVGLDQATATADIIAAGLLLGSVTTQNDDLVPSGDVISQNPVAGSTVTPGSSVDIVVSLGPADIAVPDVVGLDQATATADIIAAGLLLGSVTTQNDDLVPSGDVISQNPVAGSTVTPGSSVDIVVSLGPADIAVPDVVGLDQATATADIIAAGLLLGSVTTQNDDLVPSGDVISQNPVAGSTVTPGSSVDIVVSLGPADIAVPDVVGLDQATATADIIAAGLLLGSVTTQNDDLVPSGDVISQNPVAGSTVTPGSSVDIVVSLGPADIAVPDVVGLDQATATADIIAAGLLLGSVTTQNDDLVPSGDVISQNPVAGSTVTPGSSVDIVVSLGPADIAVPDVVGLDQATATADIIAAGLLLGSVTTQNDDLVPSGDVISQNPVAGSTVTPGSSVDIVVSLGPADIAVPDVVGLDQATATADIIAAGLLLGSVTTQNDDLVPSGDVISQNPVAGSTVTPGSSVDIVVSLGPADIAVPDVVGLDQATATADIIAAGLLLGSVTTQNDDLVPSGDVISQNPVAGSSVTPGSSVDIVVSLGPANQLPIADDLSLRTGDGIATTVLLTFTDPDGPGPYTFAIVRQPDNGSIGSDDGDAEIIYTANAGFIGTDSFDYRVDDGLDPSTIATVTFSVQHYPGTSWETRTPESLGLNSTLLDQFVASVGGRGTIVKDGYVVRQWGNQSNKIDWASAAKPVHSTLLMIAADEGLVDDIANDSIAPLVLQAVGAPLSPEDQPMTFSHLANNISGYARAEAPGEAWAYNDFGIQLYATVLADVTGGSLNAYAVSRLAPLQLQDGSVFSSRGGLGVETSVRDFARIGWLWLNRGNWGGTQVLSESLLDQFMRPQVPGNIPRTSASESDYLNVGDFGGGGNQTAFGPGIYGMNWWFNDQVGTTGNLAWPAAPNDMFHANGHFGEEMVVVLPGLNMVMTGRGDWGSFEPGNSSSGINQNFQILVNATLPPGTNFPPAAAPDSYTATQDQLLIVTAPGVLGNDSDSNGDPLSALLQNDVSSGVLSLNVDGSFTYIPNPGFTGSDSFSYFADDGTDLSNAVTVTINVQPTGTQTVFLQEADGSISMEAENFTGSQPRGGQEWQLTNSGFSGAASASSAIVVPNASNKVVLDIETTSPRTDYQINFNQTGTFYIWVRMQGPAKVSNSLHVGFDGTAIDARGVSPVNTWGWSGGPRITVTTAGLHTLNLYMREDGTFADKIIIRTVNVAPSGLGPPQSPVAGGVNVPPVAEDDAYNITEGGVLTITVPGVLTNDSDLNGDALTAVLDTDVSDGTLALAANGSFTYTPNTGFTGSDSFTYFANDGTDNSASAATVQITVAVEEIAFSDATGLLGLPGDFKSYSISWADYDGDGLVDAFLNNHNGSPTTLLRNTGGGFSDTTVAAGVSIVRDQHACKWADTDRDGDLDLYCSTGANQGTGSIDANFWRNESNGTFTDIALASGVANGAGRGRAVNWIDIENDGDLDLFVANDSNEIGQPTSILYRNDGGLFTDISGQLGGTFRGEIRHSQVFDYSEDGDWDLMVRFMESANVSGYDGPCRACLIVLENNGAGSFSIVLGSSIGLVSNHRANLRMGDFNNDGLMDVITGTESSGSKQLFRNNGNGQFVEMALSSIGLGALQSNGFTNQFSWADFDNNGFLDLYAVRRSSSANLENFLFLNIDGNNFTQVSALAGVQGPASGRGDAAAVADFDNDGALDLLLSNGQDGSSGAGPYNLLRNSGNSNNWIRIIPVNPQGAPELGARITIGTPDGQQYREFVDQNGTYGADELVAHFGIGSNSSVTFVRIEWRDGTLTELTNIPANQELQVEDPVVISSNNRPVVIGDTYSMSEDGVLVVPAAGVLTNDSDLNGDSLTAVLDTDVSDGNLALAADGSFAYTPNTGFTGSDSFTYFANDGTDNSASAATVQISVNPIAVNVPPAAAPDSYTATQDQMLIVPAPGVLGNDSDSNGDLLSAVLQNDVSDGVLSLNADGSFTYIPNPGFTGSDSFTYFANDGTDNSASATTVQISVNPIAVNVPPAAAPDSYTATQDQLLIVTAPGVLGNDSDSNGDPLSALLQNDVSSGVLSLNVDGSFTYIPNPGFTGSDSFSYFADDGTDLSNAVTVTINVQPTGTQTVFLQEADGSISMEAENFTGSQPRGGQEWQLTNSGFSGAASASSAIVVPNASNKVVLDIETTSPRTDYQINFNQTGTFYIWVRMQGPAKVSNSLHVGFDGTAIDARGVSPVNTWGWSGGPRITVTTAGLHTLNLYMREDGTFADKIVIRTVNVAPSGLGPPQSPVSGGVNVPPVAEDDAYNITEGGVLTITVPGVLTNDSDLNGDALTAVLDTDVSDGTLALAANGSFTYTPNTGFTGSDSFTYFANDGTDNSASAATVQITVNPIAVNVPPAATPDSYSGTQDQMLIVTAPGVLGNDSDSNGDPLSALLQNDVSSGVLSLNADGSFTYIPNPGFTGSDSFSYFADDGTDLSNAVTVTINVQPTGTQTVFLQEADGSISMEAENFTGSQPRGGQEWQLTNSGFSGAASASSAIVVPNASNKVVLDIETTSPRTDYQINFNQTGTFYIWVRMQGPAKVSNSLHVGFDGTAIDARGVSPVNTWGWSDGPRITVTTAGLHTLNLYMREDGTFADKIIIRTVNVAPSGLGPPQSPVAGGSMSPTANSDSFSVEAGNGLVASTAGVLSNDVSSSGFQLEAVLVGDVSNGTLSLGRNGSIAYTPDDGFTGTDSFQYQAQDSFGQSNIAVADIFVNAPATSVTAPNLVGMQLATTVVAGDREWSLPAGFGSEAALSLERIRQTPMTIPSVAGARFGQIVVDPGNPSWFAYNGVGPVFIAGAGDPENFLHRGDQLPDGTRDGDQMRIIDRISSAGANGMYFTMIRSNGGDGDATHNPFNQNDPAMGLNADVLHQWDQWLTEIGNRGVNILLLFYDDGTRIWDTGDLVTSEEQELFEQLVNRFEHHRHLVWCIVEEYGERYTAQRISNLAAIVRAADDYGHPIAVHKNTGLSLTEFYDDPNIDQFAIQQDTDNANTSHNAMLTAWNNAAGRINLNFSENKLQGTGSQARLLSWATAMGGAYTMVHGMKIVGTAISDMQDLARLGSFFEAVPVHRMAPHDELAFGGARLVMGNPGSDYIAYRSGGASQTLGIRSLAAGLYRLRWLDPATGQLALSTAETALATAGQRVGQLTGSFSGSIAPGFVISQNPIPGTAVAPGSRIDLEISLGTSP